MLKDQSALDKLAKEIIKGEKVEMICRLHEKNNLLGRSVVIDLEAPKFSNFRQVDHRSIDWIVFKNVKYSLGKRETGIDELPLKVDRTAPKWDLKKLAVGNWFS